MSPMVSKAQWRKLFATNPAVAKEFADATTTPFSKLPEHAAKKKRPKHRGRRRRG
jgi:hypothetical protein